MTTTSETWAPPTEFAEDLKERYGLECPPRWGTPRHPDRPSLGPKLWKVMERLGAPPMPWQNYSRMSDDDLKAVFAYLKSVPPVRNHVPDYAAPE